MQPQPKSHFTPEEYLALERRAETKSEYWNGQIYALAGASSAHNTIVANLIISLGVQLKGRPCTVYPSDMRVKVAQTGLYTYPDVLVLCGKARFDDLHRDTLLNPTVLIEVLSPTTETYDRGAKFAFYRSLESLTDYLLVAQDSPKIEHYALQPNDKWLLSDYKGLDAVAQVASIDCALPLADVYDKIDWSEAEPEAVSLRVLRERAVEYGSRPGDPVCSGRDHLSLSTWPKRP
ncbi:MAG: hypothetical protein CVU38_07350 [Chloroflexi bacterium HGW-Chloroflexi-1]|nr:MAG: hypothetical protein CVU38_07350 [Chloroflexi bacterium HGW-Chloroflexi-1]